jgi:hypothetical protein
LPEWFFGRGLVRNQAFAAINDACGTCLAGKPMLGEIALKCEEDAADLSYSRTGS